MEWTNELVLPGGDVAASDRAQGSIFFVGNATVILSYAGFTILTDPNFLHRRSACRPHSTSIFRRRAPWRSPEEDAHILEDLSKTAGGSDATAERTCRSTPQMGEELRCDLYPSVTQRRACTRRMSRRLGRPTRRSARLHHL
jgi:hypothetical protein